MRIKKYKYFQINESFHNSIENSDFLTNNSLPDYFFLENLYESSDIPNCDVKINTIVTDEKGLFIEEFKDKEEYRIKYMILISYKQLESYDFDKFNVIDDLSTIRLSIQEMISRCKSKNLELNYNKVYIEGVPKTSPSNISSRTIFSIHFIGGIINNELKKYYQKWNKSIGDKYQEMMRELEEFYINNDHDFYKIHDSIEENDKIVIDVFTPNGELYHVATYYKSSNTYEIDDSELEDSIYDW